MKLTALLLTALCLAGTASAQEKTFTMGSQASANSNNTRLVQTVRQGPQGTSIHFTQPSASLTPKQPQPLIFGLASVDLSPSGTNLMSYGALVPHQAFVGAHPSGNPPAGGAFPAFGWNQYAGPLMPFYGGGVGVVLGDGAPKLWGW